MKALKDYKNMVIAMTTQGIDVKAALDAAEVVVFGIENADEKKSAVDKKIAPAEENRKPVKVHDEAPKESNDDGVYYASATIIAERMGISTRQLNIRLMNKGFLQKIPLLNKPLNSNSPNTTTYSLTLRGKRYGKQIAHVKYKDGSVAVWQHKWKTAIIEALTR